MFLLFCARRAWSLETGKRKCIRSFVGLYTFVTIFSELCEGYIDEAADAV